MATVATATTGSTISWKARVFGIYIDRGPILSRATYIPTLWNSNGASWDFVLCAVQPIAYFITSVIYILLKILNLEYIAVARIRSAKSNWNYRTIPLNLNTLLYTVIW